MERLLVDVLHLTLPGDIDAVCALRAGQRLLLSGVVYTARDAAHARLCGLLEAREALPFDCGGAAVFYAGPCPAPEGRIIGSIGPTTAGRMDAYAPRLMEAGLRVMIGKGPRSRAVMEAMGKTGSVYLAAIGGAAALMAARVTQSRVVAFEDLGTEAVRVLTVCELPLVVAGDRYGGDVYA